MKQLIITFLFALACTSVGMSQNISENAIGIRTGDNDGFGVEISYQRALGDNNRLELDLGLRSGNNYDGFKLTGLYQWVWVLDGNFNWYAGAGGGVGSYSFDDDIPVIGGDNETFVFAAGNLGIEYNFDIPLILSLDVRPEFGFGDFNDDFDFDLGLGIRYQF